MVKTYEGFCTGEKPPIVRKDIENGFQGLRITLNRK